jgi:midasin
MLSHSDVNVKWCGAHCLGLSLSGGDAFTATLLQRLLSPEDISESALMWQNACAAIAIEQAAMLYSGDTTTCTVLPSSSPLREKTTGKKRKQADEPLYHGWPLTPPSNYIEVCGLDLSRKQGRKEEKETGASPLVLTPSMQRNLQSCALGLCMESPILLEGPPSSGKSALLAHLAEITDNSRDLVRVHLDDQTDSKTLLGAYVCATKPGEFVWQPGLLTQAVVKGSWVVIEDINLASAEVLATLLPLVERRMLHIPSRGEELTAAQGFQLIATVTSDPGAMGAGVYGSSAAVRDLLGGLFHSVRMEPATPAEQAEIVGKLFPPVATLVPHAMASVALVQVATRQRTVSSFSARIPTAAGEEDEEKVEEEDEHFLDQRIALALSDAGLRPGECNLGRYFSFRDVLKWAKRMVAQHLPLIKRSLKISAAASDGSSGASTSVADVPIALREAAFVEAADCLCSGLSNHEAADKLLIALASLFAVPASTAEHYSQLAKPAVAIQGDQITIGRASLPLLKISGGLQSRGNSRFAQTGHAMRHMERVAVAAVNAEPVLLVGETGTGKTTLVQEIASQVGAKLVVVNLSQQTDSSDLIGGFRPLQPADPVVALLPGFIDLVRRTWQRGNNDEFLDRVVKMATKRRWQQLVKAYRTAVQKTGLVETPSAAPEVAGAETSTANGSVKKSKKMVSNLDTRLREEWAAFVALLDAAENTAVAAEGGFAFGFFEGALLQAVREGWWLLLDEINLAPAEALERISGLLEEDDGSITVAERGDVDAIAKHPNFRIFAAMNPATDAGKRDLPGPLRNRFTEIWVGEPRHRDDLAAIVAGHLLPISMGAPVHDVVDFYLAVKDAADTTLQDGAGHKPTYNLRTLSRALEYAARASAVYGLQRALYDGFAMSFLTQLDPASNEIMEKLMLKHLVGQGTNFRALMNASPSAPSETCVLFDHYWVEVGDSPVAETREDDGKGGVFVATPTVMQHLRNLARAVLLRKYPILLQGPTSSGKTSLVGYLAAQTGHHFVRINNHEQTDLQEYLGTYVSDEQGRLVFQEGLLVQAVRKGHWIVLDELNLAPTEVLEALNRLLDDNRELFVPELQEVVKPHPHFMLFATQNPPGLYAGRKTLSRAFRSRFLELHVEDIPDDELHVILEKRCAIAPSYANKLVSVMRELQRRRALSNVFAGRHGFITPRDLFRWAGRGAIGYQQLAEDGYAVLGERLRSDDERNTVNDVLLKILNAKIDMQALYDSVDMPQMSEAEAASSGVGRLVWTKTFRRMYWLLERCLRTSEPALLVGETGLGKTSVCQLAAFTRDQTLRIINCNQHTETSDFLGGYRPNRSRESALSSLRESIEAFNVMAKKAKAKAVAKPKSQSITELQAMIVEAMNIANGAGKRHKEKLLEHAQAMEQHLATYRAPFEWVDGPLIVAMKRGDIILIDELNLAEDSVLERLNSVLEPSRSVTLAEKGGNSAEVIVAHPDFRVIATMNPGGDYGKKELSPALSNRFTTIWVPAMEDEAELRAILEARITDPELRQLMTPLLLKFWDFYKNHVAASARQVLSVRDLLTWIEFVNSTAQLVNPYTAFAHGAHVAFLDGIGLGVGLSEEASITLRSRCMQFLTGQLPNDVQQEVEVALSLKDSVPSISEAGNKWGLAPFFLDRISEPSTQGAPFDFNAPTTAKNAFRVLRAMQLRKPILLEGSPGVGKTSLIAAVSTALGRGFVRINLSEQTDMMDLLGADLPVEGGGPGEFAWSDGPLLQAIKSGAWVLLDELNLANQTVLEGLNALLDHRAEVFIPELNAKFKCAPGFRIFGAQNPLQEGGGRKGLPKSFLNRFSRVHVELLQRSDLLFIAGVLYPSVPSELLQQMVEFLHVLHTDARETRIFGAVGGPWEFNLRDLLRWCELITSSTAATTMDHAYIALHYAQMLFVNRMRTLEDRAHVLATLESFLPGSLQVDPQFYLTPQSLQIGWATLPRHKFANETLFEKHALLGAIAPLLESVAECISLNWMCLLVGPSGSGKTAVLRTLAQLSGRDLLELPLNSGTDTSDLLGGFEQVDMVRKRHLLIALVEEVFTSLMATILATSFEVGEQVGNLAGQWRELKSASESPSATAAAAESVLSAISTLAASLPEGLGQTEVLDRLQRAQLLSNVIQAAGDDMDGRFEWVDGSLTRAIIEGRWVVLDNANLCNPSVLDRLNPVLEPHGVLYLNECGTGAQGPRVITPHPNFRLFLTFDSKHGEVSRAMRNRGLELFLLPDRLTGLSQEARAGDAAEQLQTVAALQGVPGDRLPHFMATVHSAMRDQALARHRRPPSLREMVRWVGLVRNLCSRGLDADTSMQKAFESIYIQPCDDANLREEGQNIFQACAADCPALDELWFQPGAWPLPLTVATFAADSAAMSANRDLAHVLQWAGRLALGITATSQSGGDVSFPAPAFSASSNLSQSALALSIMLPGQKIAQLLLGQSAEEDDELMIDDEALSSEQPALAVATFVQALHVFMERGAGESLHQSWAASILSQCAEVMKPLLENGGPPTSSSSIQMVMGSNVASHLTDAIQSLGVYFSNPSVSATLFGSKLTALRTAITTAVALQRASLQASSGTREANRTLLQLSSWRFENPGSRNKLPVPHPVVDWLWPFLNAAQACEESLLGQQQDGGDGSVVWSELLSEKVGLILV